MRTQQSIQEMLYTGHKTLGVPVSELRQIKANKDIEYLMSEAQTNQDDLCIYSERLVMLDEIFIAVI